MTLTTIHPLAGRSRRSDWHDVQDACASLIASIIYKPQVTRRITATTTVKVESTPGSTTKIGRSSVRKI